MEVEYRLIEKPVEIVVELVTMFVGWKGKVVKTIILIDCVNHYTESFI